MIGIMRALWWTVGSRFKSRERLEAETLALRHQVTVLRRSAPGRLRLRGSDRFLFVWLYRLWPSVLGSGTRAPRELRLMPASGPGGPGRLGRVPMAVKWVRINETWYYWAASL